MFSHRSITIILYLCFEFSEQCLFVIFIFFMNVVATVVGLVRFNQAGCERRDFGIAVDDVQGQQNAGM